MLKGQSFPGALLILVLCGCNRNPGLPQPESKEYKNLVRAFNIGLAGLQSGEDIRAKSQLTLATQIASGEPASWANLGILAMRQQELDAASRDLDKARTLAPDNSRIQQLLGDLESRRGKLPEAIQHFKRAVELDDGNLKALYALAEQTERQGTGESDSEALAALKKLLDRAPGNLAVLLDVTRLAGRVRDADTQKKAIAALVKASSSWPAEAKERLQDLERAAAANPGNASVPATFLRNVLLREPAYRQDANAVKTPPVFAGEPFVRFLRLPSPDSEPAGPDTKLTFESQPLSGVPNHPVHWVRAVYLDDSGKPSVLWSDATGIHLPGADFPQGSIPATADLNYDFKTDLVLAGPAGLRIYQQEQAGRFTDVTPRSGIPKQTLNDSYTGAWPFDIDLDGDLDIVLGVKGRPPVALRNNADGTFAIARPFAGPADLVSFATADIDGDGDPDVAAVGADGRLSVWINERFGKFRPRTVPQDVAQTVAAGAAGDIDGNGSTDFIVLTSDGTITRLSDKSDGTGWNTSPLVKTRGPVSASATLTLADFDNNGALDLLAGDGEIFLSDRRGFTPLAPAPKVTAPGVADFNGDGRLDLAGLNNGLPVSLISHGTKNYKWQVIRTRAANAQGDQRINSFGLGGEIEIRAGLLTQKQIITSPVLHFGLGEHESSDLARIVWPNGFIQVEFELKADQSILAAQRLKGSCPSLFAWDGKRISFVKDGAPWSPALGLHINAQEVAGIYQTEEWFKIPGDRLVPRDGYYDLRVTAELWETYYIDHYSLLVVDHPKDVEIYSDERFAVPPPALKIYPTQIARPFAKAVDDTGHDVSGTVAQTDRAYLDTFGRGQYQGVTRDHWVELELPDDAPRTGPLYLIGDGWMHPTDATVNIALGQTHNPPPQGLRIEVPRADGRWIVARSGLGFPAGKLKTVVLDITNLFQPGAPRKLRLGTNMEVYWDRLAWAQEAPQNRIRTQKAPLTQAALRYRGFSVMRAANPSSPETPDYEILEATGQKWRDLEGYYTRYGDIRELLDKVDDRIVIVNAGDEMRFRFAAPPPPPEGWTRDFIMIGDGWIKDGDYNSVFSTAVLPLPYHGMKDYTVAAGKLEEDPAWRKHPQDWERFHTRYITPDFFRDSLWVGH